MTPVQPAFEPRDDGTVDVRLGPSWTAFEEALNDAVGTRAPAGYPHPNPSAFWIDRALAEVHAATQEDVVIAQGNATSLMRRADEVVALSLYDMWDQQAMPVRDFVRLLTTWRNQVLPIYTAPDGSFEIEPRWKEEVVYWEGDRGFLLDAGWGVEPPVLYVPTAAAWRHSAPAWLHGRRDDVVSQLSGHSRHRIEETADGYNNPDTRDLRR